MDRFKIFSNENLGSVRVIYKEDGTPWFFTADVCTCLLVNNSRQAITRLDSDEKDTVILNDSVGRPHKYGICNESGLYALIMTSRKKEARDFQKWVTKEVLPSIRKNGGYIFGQENLPSEEKDELLSEIARLSKNVAAYKEDGDLWMNMYLKVLDEYKAEKKFISSEVVLPKPEREYVLTRDGWIVEKSLLEK